MTPTLDSLSSHGPLLFILLAAAGAIVAGVLLALVLRRRGARVERSERSCIRGLTYVLENDTDKAIEEFIRFTHLDPDTTDVYIGLGHLYRAKGDFDRAIRLHRSILARPDLQDDDRLQTLLALGADYRSAGLWGRAVDVYRQALAVNPAKLDCYRDLAAIHEEERNWEAAFRARQEYERRTGSKAKNVLAHLQAELGKDALSQGDRERAHKAFKSALSLDPGCLDAALHLGDLFREEGKTGKAIDTWEKVALSPAPFAYLAYRRLEKAYFDENRYDDIAGLLESVLKSNPDNVMARITLGGYYAKREMTAEAIGQLSDAIRIYPRSIEARRLLAEVLVRNRMHEEIEREYPEAIEALYSPEESFLCSECGFKARELSWRCPQCRRWDTFSLRK